MQCATSTSVANGEYFMLIGSQGFIGFGLYLTFWLLVWRQCGWLRRHGRAVPDRLRAFQLGSMTEVSLFGYAVGGAFLDLAFWNVPYYPLAMIAAARYAAEHEVLAGHQPLPAAAAPALVGGAGATGPVGRTTL